MNLLKLIIFFSLLGSNSVSGITYEPNVLWEKASIKYCFFESHKDIFKTELINGKNAKKKFLVIPGPLSNKQETFIAEQIKRNFSKDSTGIHFERTNNCDNGDLVILKNRKMQLGGGLKHYGRASIGEAGEITSKGPSFFKKKKGFYGKKGSKAYVALSIVDKVTLIHELGHIAGLRHEHARDEAETDKGCKFERSASQGRSSLHENLFITTDISNYYDSKSFMNYCYINFNRKEINSNELPILSKQDKEELKSLYSF